MKPYSILLLMIMTMVSSVRAQRWVLHSFDAGYRIFEVNAVGNNPTTIAPLLKEPGPYLAYLDQIKNNSLAGNPGVSSLNTFYISAQWRNDQARSRFWEKYRIQTALLITKKITQDIGFIGDENYTYQPDTVYHRYLYSLVKEQQFAGLLIGLNRNFPISRKFQILTGLHAQGSVAVVHRYKPSWDSSTYTPGAGWNTHITRRPDLAGKNFFQWQLMVPIGLEYALYKQTLSIRLEVDAGIVGGRYRPKFYQLEEAHGAGLWLIFKHDARFSSLQKNHSFRQK